MPRNQSLDRSITGAGLLCKGQVALARLCEVEKHDDRWITHRGVMTGEAQSACVAIHAEHRDVVAPLVAGIKELAGGIEI